MTPKEKAKSLVEKYAQLLWGVNFKRLDNYIKNEVKNCAIIAVDEIMLVTPYIDKKSEDLTLDQYRANDNKFMSYWQEVKQEISNL